MHPPWHLLEMAERGGSTGHLVQRRAAAVSAGSNGNNSIRTSAGAATAVDNMLMDALPIGNHPQDQQQQQQRSARDVFEEVCAKHREYVRRLASTEDQTECSSCVLYKRSFNEDTSEWTSSTWEAAVSCFVLEIICGWNTKPDILELQRGVVQLQEDAMEASSNSMASQHTFGISVTVRQMYVSVWAAACFVGMVIIAGIFIVQRINDEVSMGGGGGGGSGSTQNGLKHTVSPHHHNRQDSSLSASDPSSLSLSTMTKSEAMVLCFLYTAFAWMMSNGIVLNPRLLTV